MTASGNIPQDTRFRQHRASNPAQSVWVSANAGAGKTHVLVQRVLRLLLKGVPPARILCLTFTKAAAANMSLRVFNALAEWTRLDDRDLREAIFEASGQDPKADELVLARRLFARTVETPGGLKIQTIHAFCERLLHLFPFEANVPARFQVLEDLGQTALLGQARAEVLTRAAHDTGLLGLHLERIVTETSDAGFDGLIREALTRGALFRKLSPQDYENRLRRLLHLSSGDSVTSITKEMIEGGIDPSRWNEIATYLDQGSKADKKNSELFREAVAAWTEQRIETCLELYLQFFFTQKDTPTERLMTAGLSKARPDLAFELDSEQLRLNALCSKRKAAATLERSVALIAIAKEVFARYAHLKAARGLLDFADLIDKTLALLSRSDARWVLYKLDRGIDHILVDEAQDTSKAQWKILEELMSEFAVGANASGGSQRTFFAVGDDKQSIFSFQGAAPHMFHAMRGMLEKKFRSGGEDFTHVQLSMSFRSVPAVLAAVDHVFSVPFNQKGLVESDQWMGHDALKKDLPGLVELWPLIAAKHQEDADDWSLPLDVLSDDDPASLIANRIAAKITMLLSPHSNEFVFDAKTKMKRLVQPGDILILVRTRGPFFEAVIRALKHAGVPVAGADRLDLTAHIAVMDLIAAGRSALLPQDDLTLAAVLKSPLIGLDDDDLLKIAPGRPASLFEALARSPEEKHRQAFAKISLWRERAAHELPFTFYMRLLSEDGGRHDMEARLGLEACDAIDEFLRLALLHEKEPAASLSLFLASLENIDLAIKRDMETGTEAVRVMTVHAAKGLEAKIVFLPDTCSAPSPHHDPQLFALADAGKDPLLVWSPRKAEDCPEVAAARQNARDAASEEYRRLLYVALTRAEERLYIAGFHGFRPPAEDCWYGMMQTALESELRPVTAFWNQDETLLRHQSLGVGQLATMIELPTKAAGLTVIPDWLRTPAPFEASPLPPLRPSTALAAADSFEARPLISPAQREAMRRGQLMHVLLQYLPDVSAPQRSTMGKAFLAARAEDMPIADRMHLVDTILSVIEAPDLQQLFAAGSKAEVPVAGKVHYAGRQIDVVGQIDRIAESATEVLIADFKTGEPQELDATPQAYLVQMALYRAALAPLWPQKRLRMMLIWTYGPKIVELTDVVLHQALATLERQIPPAA